MFGGRIFGREAIAGVECHIMLIVGHAPYHTSSTGASAGCGYVCGAGKLATRVESFVAVLVSCMVNTGHGAVVTAVLGRMHTKIVVMIFTRRLHVDR